AEVKAVIRHRGVLLLERQMLDHTPMDPDERARQRVDLDDGIAEVDAWLAEHRVRGTLPTPNRTATPWHGAAQDDDATAPLPAAGKASRVMRSTRRRADAGALPSLPVTRRTVGRVYTGREGRTYQPSMLLTVTCDSYGQVHTGARTRRG